MHIIAFLYRKSRGNTFGSAGQETYTNFCAYVLAWVRPYKFSQNYSKSQLGRINIRMIIYLDDMLLMGHSIEEISMCRDTVVFLLQHLGFVINWKKSVLTPVQEIEFLGLKINSVNLEISLTEEKIQKVKTKCQNLLTEPETSILELTRVIGLLA